MSTEPCFICFVTQLPGKKDLFIEADLMSPLDRIASLSTLKVKLLQLFFKVLAAVRSCAILTCSTVPLPTFQQHEVDKLYKVEYKPISSTSEQWVPSDSVYTHTWCTHTHTWLVFLPLPTKTVLPDPTQNTNCEMDLWWVRRLLILTIDNRMNYGFFCCHFKVKFK